MTDANSPAALRAFSGAMGPRGRGFASLLCGRAMGVSAVAILLCGVQAAAFWEGRATSAAPFLKLGVGARAAAMGDAFSAAAEDASAVAWNPAALALLGRGSASMSHAAYLGSSSMEHLAYGQSLGPRGALGVGLHYFSAGSLNETDEAGVDAGAFTPNDMALAIGYAYEWKRRGPGGPGGGPSAQPAVPGGYGSLGSAGTVADSSGTAAGFAARAGDPGLSAGLAVKYIRSQIKDTAQTAALDLGVLSPPLLDGKLRLAFTASNLGGTLRYEAEDEPLPRNLRLGGAWRPGRAWLAALDLNLPQDGSPWVGLGAEKAWPFGPGRSFAGRAGFSSRGVGAVDGLTGVAFGFGVLARGLGLDYAMLPFGSLGISHRVSLSFAF